MLKKNFLKLVGAGCRNLLIASCGAALTLAACSTEAAPAARDAPPRTMAPEVAEPEVEAIDVRRVEASAKVVVEQEPLAMAAEVEVHEHAEEPAEEMQDDSEKCPDGMCVEEEPTVKPAAKPATKAVTKPKKSLIR